MSNAPIIAEQERARYAPVLADLARAARDLEDARNNSSPQEDQLWDLL